MRSLALAAMAAAADNPEERSGVLAAARAGDLPAFELLMRRYERLVLVTALRLAGNLPDAQDVSQEVFLKLYRNLGKLRSEDAAASWLYRVTVNACGLRIPSTHYGTVDAKTGVKYQGSFEYIDSGIDQDVDVKEGQKVVVGRSSLEGPQQALFLILTAHVIQ
jgi:hypothetical protein